MTGAVIGALVPVALLIALGAGMRRAAFLHDAFWPQAERLGYYVLLPSLFLHSLATARLAGVPVAGLAGALAASTVATAVALVASRRWVGGADAAFTSVFQGGVRFNSYVGVAVASGLLGPPGVALAAVAVAAIVPTVNVLCVLVFARYGAGAQFTARGVGRQLVGNPLLVACAAGIVLQASGLGLPPGLEPVLRALGAASLPLGLLCVGAALEVRAARHWARPVAVASAFKFVAMPAATAAACRLLGVDGAAAVTAVLFQALPTAPSGYILARQLGGDAPLMAGITAAQTVLAGVAVPVALLLLAG